MASLPLVASALGDKYGVTVNIGGNQAYTDGKNINLPTLPLDCDAELLALARSFLDHEAAHIRHTEFAALQAANLTPLEKHLWNCLEDWRCENALAAIYPGCRQHFRWLILHYFDNGKDDDRAGDDSPALSVLNYVLLTVRTWDVPAIEKRKRTEGAVVRHVYPGLLSRLDAVLDHVRRDCRSTRDAIDYALKLAAVIEEYTKNPAAEQKEGEDKEEDSRTDAPDTDTSDAAPESCGGATPDKGGEANSDCAAQSEEAGCTESASQTEESAASDSQAESPRTQRTAHAAAQKQLAEILYASEAELPRHLGQRIAEALNVGRVSPHQQGLAVARTGHKHTGFLPEEVRTESVKNSIALRTRLHGLLQTITRQPCVMGRRGKLCPQRLHGLAVHNPRVFLKRGEKRQVSTAVHLLLDCSGSMSGARMELASRACYAVALALEQCRGVNVGVTAFPGNDTRPGITVAPILRHGERVHHKFSMSGTGYTPLAEALWWVMQRMCPLKEERKVILILSDGSPDSVPAAQHALQQAVALGFEVMGLGIQDNNLALLLPPLGMPTRTIHDLPELAPAMFDMLQKTLLGQGGRA